MIQPGQQATAADLTTLTAADVETAYRDLARPARVKPGLDQG